MIAADYADTWSAIGPQLKQQNPDTKNTWRDATNKPAAEFSGVSSEAVQITSSACYPDPNFAGD